MPMTAGEEGPVGGPTRHDRGRTARHWQNAILGILMEQMKAGDPGAEEAILWLRAKWGFEEGATRRGIDRWKAICEAETRQGRGSPPRIIPSDELEAAIGSEEQPKPPRPAGETPS